MTSTSTVSQVIATIRSWQKDFGLSDAAIATLLRRLEKIDGNKSFRDTVSSIADNLKRFR